MTTKTIVLHRDIDERLGKRVKFNLTRERLNSGGYTARGRYFGTGAPLFYYSDFETGEISDYIRAADREHAKQLIRAKYPNATFFN